MSILINKIKERLSYLDKRVLWVDIAKALAIICVIWGHAGSGSQVILYRSILYTFHIPVFLLVSGYLMKFPKDEDRNIKGVLSFILKNILTLAVPYIFWAIFFADFKEISNVWSLLFGSYQSIKTVNPIGALWFIPSFFFARLFCYFVMFIFGKVKLKKIFISIFALAFFAIGFLLPLLDNGYFWSINISFVLAGFILLGVLLKEVLDILSNAKWWILLIVAILSFTGFFFGTFFRKDELELVCIYNGNYGNLFWFFYNAIFGTTFVISISMLIGKISNPVTRAIQYIGNQTLGLLIFHVPFMRQVMMPLFNNIGFTSPDWLAALCGALITLIVCLAFNTLVLLVCPELLGRLRKNK